MSFDNDDTYLPISALQHFVFCRRQCALIHIERQWQENVLTARGRIEHNRVHEGYKEVRRGRRQLSGLHIRSEKLSLQGQLDVLELESLDARAEDNLSIFGVQGMWDIYPVEFKHGQSKQNDCDRVQLCAQALCLEEMTGLSVCSASLFYHRIRKREDVLLDDSLRQKTIRIAREFHALFDSGITPAPVYGSWCKACSMLHVCLPKKMGKRTSAYRQLLFTQQEVTE
ncbi:CRISPR-associated protein Cas4 [candidate division KSB1 bacterium]|nr:CRISPR-associated protein Cas4 [candidate division KSB1 bacterium]RQW04208.1 MAG: CRISPR-associated protein Cas4 [candidate division KSB1 bacterium]